MKKDESKVNNIGARIKDARESLSISQAQLATILGFQSATAISLIESGERGITAPLLQRISEVLKRDIKYFLGQEENFVDVRVALRADKDLSDEDKDAIDRFIELAKQKKNGQ
ncbi:MAG: helix-turn-helix transcriptional regulator [Bacteroidetes bacterium]|nr:helix-turn-helix transcriptional regulator [Bacteroidota bacterium]